MNIEVNKQYLLRNRGTVLITSHHPNSIWTFGGTMRHENGNIDRAAFFTYSGMYNPDKGENERDIIKEIK